ncbi:MAG: outer membrane lipoprotein carrier protein LolA [Phaeodactylibacter sp.]|nr:outer membrane lipoprotein carrier protein LolA [Phaeodactylibacter sp.]
MKNLLMICAGLILSVALQAQDYTKAVDADPAAKALLEKLKAKYEGYNSMAINFSLLIEFPEEPQETQKGTLLQQGNKFRLDMEAQRLISDGKSVWLYLKNNKEVQINDAEQDDSGGILSPNDLLKVYNSGEYVYALINAYEENGRLIQQIEFKPLDSYSEYSKIRLTIDKNKQEVIRIKAFSKDGSRYTLLIDSLTPNPSVPAGSFVWNKSECPDCYVEDLRID